MRHHPLPACPYLGVQSLTSSTRALGSAASLEDVMMDNVMADFAVAARAIVKGFAVVSSGVALQQGSHRSRTRRSMCDILAFATFLSRQRRQQCLDLRVKARLLSMQSLLFSVT